MADTCRTNSPVLAVSKRVALYIPITFTASDDNCMIFVYNFNVPSIFTMSLPELLNSGAPSLTSVTNMATVTVSDHCPSDTPTFTL